MKKLLFMLLATVLSLTQIVAQTEPITIGTGMSATTSGPIPGSYGNHRSIQLFTAAELGEQELVLLTLSLLISVRLLPETEEELLEFT